MKILLTIVTMAFLGGCIACSDGKDDTVLPVPTREVQLVGAIGSTTRAVINSGYEKDLDVCFARQDETGKDAGTYGLWRACPAKRTNGNGNRPIVFSEAQLYLEGGEKTRLHGYYPADANQTSGEVQFTVDGATDLMSTGLLTGDTYYPVTLCTFNHLLTQLQFVCYSLHPEQWGSIKSLEVVDVRCLQKLDLGAVTPVLTDASAVGDIRDLAVQGIKDLPIPEVTDPESVLPDAQGYVLLPVLPVTGTSSDPACLRVVTTKDGRGNDTETTTEVYLYVEGGFKTGQRHLVTLSFTDGNQIEAVSVDVMEWTDDEQDELPV